MIGLFLSEKAVLCFLFSVVSHPFLQLFINLLPLDNIARAKQKEIVMARELPEVTDHLISLTPGLVNTVKEVQSFVSKMNCKRVHVYADHYDRIKTLLGGSGFDVARGFKIAGAKALRYQR